MSIDDATPEDWDKIAERYFDNREFPKDVKPECTLIRGKPPETGKFEWDRYAPSPDDYVDGPFGAIHKSDMGPDVKPYDSVENPMHYEGVIECIDYIEDRLSRDELIGYYYGSVLKYAHRWKQKGGVESLRKCRWFLNRLITTEATGGMDDE